MPLGAIGSAAPRRSRGGRKNRLSNPRMICQLNPHRSRKSHELQSASDHSGGTLRRGAVTASPAVWAQTSRSGQKVVLGQSVPLTGAAEQIGLAYFNGAKICFAAINAKNGAGGYKIEAKALDDGYDAARAAETAKKN